MNNRRLFQSVLFCFASFTLFAAAVAAPAWAATRKGPTRKIRDEFFIISEVHLKEHNLVLELPTQITMLMRVTSKTIFINGNGHRQPLNKIRAGDTVYINYLKAPRGPLALKIREGPMTVQILRKRYWNG